ncbi:DDE-type integrase/transposase/recombinase [Levyella massiliensis]|uniref:DDE-type integrase/transposase/recombinase n=1 Tax=Levyella massiliensis TaxID=938289 RepID=UPI003EB6D9E5
MSTSIAKTQRYLPHTLETRFRAVKTYRLGWSVKFVVRRYKISKASLMRWNRRYDGTIDSLRDRSHRPKTPHPNAHTQQKKNWIMPDKFYQYTVMDEASRERFIYAFCEQSSYSSVEFIKMAIKHFGYQSKIIQTDNGFEFTHFRETRRTHPFDLYCQKHGIVHQLIRPRTPRHNGKVERSHRNDNERFYSRLSFYSYEDFLVQMKRYLYKLNRLPMQTLGWLTPMEKRTLLMAG